MPNYLTVTDVAVNDVLTATYLNNVIDDFLVISKHDHSPSAGEGNNIVTSASGASSVLERYYFFPTNTSVFHSTSGAGFSVQASASLMGGLMWGFSLNGDSADGDWYKIQLPLFKGIYKMQMLYLVGPSGGTACIIINSSTMTSVDTYAVAAASAMYTLSNISIPSSGSFVLQVQMTAKNTLSAASIIKLGGLTLVKTSNG